MIKAIFTEDVNTVSVSGLTQWDYGRKLHISGINLPDCAQVHFACQSLYAEAVIRLSQKVEDGYVVDIPNECLREPYDIKAWVYEVDEGHGETIKTVLLPLFKRTRPKDFVNPPDPAEETLLNEWIEKINENIEGNASFKADITESEKVRVANEEIRKSNETERVSAEELRIQAESARATAETERVNAENKRVANEKNRVSAEETRQANEEVRENQENQRVQEFENLKTDVDKVANPLSKNITIQPSQWVGGVYTLNDSLITPNTMVLINQVPATDENKPMIEVVQNANLIGRNQGNGFAEIVCCGDVPSTPISLQIVYSGKLNIVTDPSTVENLTAQLTELKQQLADLPNRMHPVGSFYVTSDETNPNELFGGTWEQVKDRFILACGDEYKIGQIGGKKEVILTIEQMPAHNHGLAPINPTLLDSGGEITIHRYSAVSGMDQINGCGDGEKRTFSRTTSITGGSKPHENMPPYETAYIWKRIA